MPLRLEQKQAMVAQVNEVAGRAHAAIAAEYRGMKAGQLDALRRAARQDGAYLRVVKNTLAKLALAGTEFECMNEALGGPLILGFSLEDPGAAARVLRDHAKKVDALTIKAVAIGGKLYPAAEAERLATLPTREQALGMLAGVMQAPISKFVRTLAEPNAKLARTMAAVRDQKQAAYRRIALKDEIGRNAIPGNKRFRSNVTMAVTKEEILETISGMTVMDVVELVSMMEEKFGVSAAAPVAVAAGGAAAAGEGAPAEEEKTEFDVVMTSFGANKVGAIKAVRAVSGLGLKEAKELVESAPATIKEGANKEEAEEIKAKLEEAGASVEVK